MKLNVPTVGPIVGFTSSSENRIWFRGEFEATGESSYRRCFGILRYRKVGTTKWSDPLFNKMSPNFDMTCVLAILNLKADVIYEYQAGWIYIDAELEKINSIAASLFEWPENIYSFKAANSDLNRARSYVVGSCRYLLKTFIGNIFDDRGDKIFKSILLQHQSNPIDGVMMMGDQIYADDLNFLNQDTKLSEFLLRYRTVFSQENIKELMSSIPTYMILDDHEIEDNWPSKASDKDRVALYPNAIHAYQIYQCSHSPLFKADSDGRIDGILQKFWYTFSDGCTDWFVMDSRTERVLSDTKPRMIKQDQLDALLSWLDNGSSNVKMIVTSVPFVPDLNSDSDDKWGAFPEQRTIILDKIKKINTAKVVFLSGDVHCSFAAEIKHVDFTNPIAYQIVSSSFFWPYPHMNEGDFIQDKPLTTQGKSKYTSRIISEVIADDNFVRLDISPLNLIASFYKRKGEKIGSKEMIFLE